MTKIKKYGKTARLKFKFILMMLTGVFMACTSLQALEPGAVLFSDNFDTYYLFAENWKVLHAPKKVESKNGKLQISDYGSVRMTRDTPLEFYVEMELTLFYDKTSSEKNMQYWSGFSIEGQSFQIRPTGRAFMLCSPNPKGKNSAERGTPVTGYGNIEGFSLGKPVKLGLFRTVENNIATYTYFINGKQMGKFSCDAPKPDANGKYAPLIIGTVRNDFLTIDNFMLCGVKKNSDESPNLIINSSFEHTLDGFPPYIQRSGADYRALRGVPYETYINAMRIDTSEKHSGKHSLRMEINKHIPVNRLGTWGSGTFKGKMAVFSVWMKADRENFPVELNYAKEKKTVYVGKKWARYELVTPELPGAGGYITVNVGLSISIKSAKGDGVLWVDDMQTEFLTGIKKEELHSDRIFASPYKPSELDKVKFAVKSKNVLQTLAFSIPLLPAGVTPSADSDEWKKKALKLTDFYTTQLKPAQKTEVYLACDKEFFYAAWHNEISDPAKIDTLPGKNDSGLIFSRDSVELFLDPCANGDFFQLVNDSGNTRFDVGRKRNTSWNGNWKSSVRIDKARKSVNHFLAIPFSDISSPDMLSNWKINIARNNAELKEFAQIARASSYQQVAAWASASFPEEIIKQYAIGVVSGTLSSDQGKNSVILEIENNTGKKDVFEIEYNNQKKNATLENGLNQVAFENPDGTSSGHISLRKGGKALSAQILSFKKDASLSIRGQLSFYMNEKTARFRIKTTLVNPEKLTAVLTCGSTSVKTTASRTFTMELPLDGIKDGTHNVDAALYNGSQRIAQASGTLVKRPWREGATRINYFNRGLLHKDKHIFPVATSFQLHPQQDAEGIADILAANGFKSTFLYVSWATPKESEAFIEASEKKGMTTVLSTFSQMPEYSMTRTKFKGTEAEYVSKINRQYSRFNNILMQYVYDEPDLRDSPEKFAAWMKRITPLHPYQPVAGCYGGLAFGRNYAGLPGDILMTDLAITNPEGRTVRSIINEAEFMRSLSQKDGRPYWFFLGGANFPLHYREPSHAEQIAQSYGCITVGCTGFIYFCALPQTPGAWKGLVQVNREIMELTDALLTEEETSEAKASGDPKFLLHIEKKRNGFYYVIAVNIDANPAGKIEFTLPSGLAFGDDAEVLFENRNVSVKNGKISDIFAGHTRHVYKIKLKNSK